MLKKHIKPAVVTLSSALLLAACASAPVGPSVQVMPGKHKSLEAFQQDQEQCKTFAHSQIAGQVDAANNKAVGQAALGVLIGGIAGVAVGNTQQASGAGAALGLIAGTDAGSDTAQNAQLSIQQQFDNAYMQCMYTRNNIVPGMPQRTAAAATVAPTMPGVRMSMAQAQTKLNQIGYPCGRPDGIAGAKTVNALKSFQQDSGLPQTGQLDDATVDILSK